MCEGEASVCSFSSLTHSHALGSVPGTWGTADSGYPQALSPGNSPRVMSTQDKAPRGAAEGLREIYPPSQGQDPCQATKVGKALW